MLADCGHRSNPPGLRTGSGHRSSRTINMAQAPGRAASAVRLFDAHCHLQDSRIAAAAPSLIRAATASGVVRFAVNGTSEVRSALSLPPPENATQATSPP